MAEIQSLNRGLQVLDFVCQAGRGVSGSEVAARFNFDKSTASRLLHTLVANGYLASEAGSRRVVPGIKLHRIGWWLGDRTAVKEKARPYLKQLAKTSGECADLAVYSEGRALVIDVVEVETSLRVVGGTGRMIAVHCTAVGKALLAFSDIPIPNDLKPLMPRTITDAVELTAHLKQVRIDGYALDDEEHEPGVRCIAAPVRNAAGIVIAVLGISGPTVRVTQHRIASLAHMVMDTAEEVSKAIGYAPTVLPQDATTPQDVMGKA